VWVRRHDTSTNKRALRGSKLVVEESNEGRKVNLDLLDEVREHSCINSEALKRRVKMRQKTKMRPWQFKVADLVMSKAYPYQLENKLSPKWTNSFRVVKVLENGVCRLETLEGGSIPRTWNVANLKFYFSVKMFCFNAFF